MNVIIITKEHFHRGYRTLRYANVDMQILISSDRHDKSPSWDARCITKLRKWIMRRCTVKMHKSFIVICFWLDFNHMLKLVYRSNRSSSRKTLSYGVQRYKHHEFYLYNDLNLDFNKRRVAISYDMFIRFRMPCYQTSLSIRETSSSVNAFWIVIL